jgi:hypothetical protein
MNILHGFTNFINGKMRFHPTAIPSIQFLFDCVIFKAHFMSTHVILNIYTKIWN